MLVDDEQDITTIMKKALELHDISVDAYSDPARALSEFKPNYYHFHVLDIRMPGMSGFDLARHIWHQDPNAKVCFLSAFEIYEAEANKVFKDFNTRCFIKKPVTASMLVEHFKAHIKAISG
jgi:DNA-binding response OmpR family regulator